MQVLKSGGFQAITTRDLADHLDGVRDLPPKPVLITFDDGYKTVLTVARPILDRLGFRANLFAITGSVGGKGALSWDELKQLAQAGYEIGSHTANHSVLTRRGARESAAQHQARIPREIAGSYQKLEEKLGAPPVALAYPYGNYDAAGMRACQAAGYRLAFSIDPGPLDRQSSPWNLPRTMVVKGTSERAFRRFLATEPLHLSQLEPPVGERLAGRAYRLTGRVGDPDALSSLGVEAGKQTRLQVDPATSRLTLTTTLRRGANLVRLTSAGTPRREAGWIVVSDR
jgi:peptidoglycan/xylan/chitin deacetylase (PgdA/CDA1 family)